MKHALPKGLIANTLNTRTRRMERGHIDDDTIPRLHVSSLIKAGSQDAFCAREFVLRYMGRTDVAGAGVPPKMELLWGVGHFYGEYIVQKFLERNPAYAQYAWGDWKCICGQTTTHRTTKPEGMICNHCAHPVEIYVEVDLFNPLGTVVGHADLILCIDGYFYIYEFKSIERGDIIFDEIKEPLGDHHLQASNYYYMLRGEGKKVSKVIRYVYADRSLDGLYTKKPFREVEAEAISKRRLHLIYDKAKRCHTAIEKGVLPTRICESITCSRAKQCPKAISCFNRTRKKIRRMPLASMPASPALASTADPSTTESGTASQSPRTRTAGQTPKGRRKSPRKSLKRSKTSRTPSQSAGSKTTGR